MWHHQRVRLFVLLAAMSVALGASVWALAGPVFVQPQRSELTQELLSIDGIHKFQLAVDRLPPELADAGLREEEIFKAWKKHLVNDGYDVVEADAPRVAVHCTIYTDDDPDLLICVFFADVQQDVTVKRLKRDFFLPTCTFVKAGLARRTDLKGSAERLSEKLSREFLYWVRAVRDAPAQ